MLKVLSVSFASICCSSFGVYSVMCLMSMNFMAEMQPAKEMYQSSEICGLAIYLSIYALNRLIVLQRVIVLMLSNLPKYSRTCSS